MTIFIDRVFPSGYWHVSAIHNGQYIHKQYGGYTKREAIRLFKAELRKEPTT